MQWWLKCLKQFADFKGRARRKEYWMFALFNVIFTIAIGRLTAYLEVPEWGMIFYIVMLIPGIAVAVRRAHDVGKSGWVMIIPIYNLVIALTEGEKQENKYGPDPKGIDT